jgi:hypothetical protein
MWLQATISIDGVEGEPVRVRRHSVAPGFFRTLRIPLIEGRDIEASDVRPGGRDVVLINNRLARTHWPSTSPLGHRLRWGQRTFEIVGVVGDVRHRALLEPETSEPDVYFSLYQVPLPLFNVVVRASSEPEPLAEAIREVVREISRRPECSEYGPATRSWPGRSGASAL